MTFNDDEQIVTSQDNPGNKPATSQAGKMSLRIMNDDEAPLNESKFTVTLELTGTGLGNDRPGLDLVMVLDCSGSMSGDKLENMKSAVQFVIKKLSPIDRLSVVTFSGNPTRLCPLRQITEQSQNEIECLVNALVANGDANIDAGLETGLQVLNDRSLTSGRAVGIMLMYNGVAEVGDATKVLVSKVPVHEFAFGFPPWGFGAVERKSLGGPIAYVLSKENLSDPFSECLVALLGEVVRDLKFTVTKKESTIEKVSAGNHTQYRDDTVGSVTISFGDLYIKDLPKIVVELLLPAVSSKVHADVLKVNYTYSADGAKPFEANPICASTTRTGTFVKKLEVRGKWAVIH